MMDDLLKKLKGLHKVINYQLLRDVTAEFQSMTAETKSLRAQVERLTALEKRLREEHAAEEQLWMETKKKLEGRIERAVAKWERLIDEYDFDLTGTDTLVADDFPSTLSDNPDFVQLGAILRGED